MYVIKRVKIKWTIYMKINTWKAEEAVSKTKPFGKFSLLICDTECEMHILITAIINIIPKLIPLLDSINEAFSFSLYNQYGEWERMIVED